MEKWKSIKGHETYMVSDQGRVKNMTTGKVLATDNKQNKYQYVKLAGVSKSVHRLVAAAFLGESNMQVDHINHRKNDNRLSNLRYVTNRQNSSNRVKSGSSEYIGVYWNKRMECYESRICINNKNYYLGQSNDDSELSEIYQNAITLCESEGYSVETIEKYRNSLKIRKIHNS